MRCGHDGGPSFRLRGCAVRLQGFPKAGIAPARPAWRALPAFGRSPSRHRHGGLALHVERAGQERWHAHTKALAQDDGRVARGCRGARCRRRETPPGGDGLRLIDPVLVRLASSMRLSRRPPSCPARQPPRIPCVSLRLYRHGKRPFRSLRQSHINAQTALTGKFPRNAGFLPLVDLNSRA